MEISGAQDQMNSMMEEMAQHGQEIKSHNSNLLQGYQNNLAQAGIKFGLNTDADRNKAIYEAGLNVPSSMYKLTSDKSLVNKSGRNYLSSDEAWGKLKTVPRAGIQKAGSALEGIRDAGSTFEPGRVGSIDPEGTYRGAGVRDEDVPLGSLRQEAPTGMGGVRSAEVQPVASGQMTESNIASRGYPAVDSDDRFPAPSEGEPITQVRASGQPPSAPGSTDHTSTGGSPSVPESKASSAEELLGKASDIAGKVGTGLSMVGGLSSLEEDISQHKIVGDNTAEKIGNVSSIVAGGLDAIGEAVPILAPLGAVAGLFSAVMSGIGAIEEHHEKKQTAESDIGGTGPDPTDKEKVTQQVSGQAQGLVAGKGVEDLTAVSKVATGGSGAF